MKTFFAHTVISHFSTKNSSFIFVKICEPVLPVKIKHNLSENFNNIEETIHKTVFGIVFSSTAKTWDSLINDSCQNLKHTQKQKQKKKIMTADILKLQSVILFFKETPNVWIENEVHFVKTARPTILDKI